MNIKLITFASSDWCKFKSRWDTQLKNIHEYFYFNEKTLNDPDFNKIISESNNGENLVTKRGFYHYIWKPILLYKELKNLEDKYDLLVYADAGCSFNKDIIDSINKDIKLFSESNKIIAATNDVVNNNFVCTQPFKDKYKPDIHFLFEYPHYQATFLFLKHDALNLLLDWKNIMLEDYYDVINQPYTTFNNGGDQIYLIWLLYTKYKNKVFNIQQYPGLITRIRG